jgi:hypothetical protein
MAESQQLHQFAELYRKLKYAENHKIFTAIITL